MELSFRALGFPTSVVRDAGYDLFVDPMVPEGTFYRMGSAVFAHPATVAQTRIELDPGLSYAQKSTAHGRAVYERRRRTLKPTPPTTYEGLLAVARAV